MKLRTVVGSLGIYNNTTQDKTYYIFADYGSPFGLQNPFAIEFGWNETYISYYPITS